MSAEGMDHGEETDFGSQRDSPILLELSRLDVGSAVPSSAIQSM